MPSLLPHGYPIDTELGGLLEKVNELIGLERLVDAIPLLTRAAELAQNNAPVLANLGSLYVETGRYTDAVEILRRAAALNPQIAVTHWRLGTALQLLGDQKGAIEALEKAIDIRPNLCDARVRLALIFNQLGRGNEARQQFRLAAEYSDDPVERYLWEAEALLEEGQDKEAEKLLRAALALGSENAAPSALLGQILFAKGKFEEAAKHFAVAIALSPLWARPYYDLVRCKKFDTGGGRLMDKIGAALSSANLADIERSVLLLARGKILDDECKYKEAMESFDEASTLRSKAFSTDITRFEQKIDRIISLFSSEFIAKNMIDNPDRTAVFVVGMPRSGTTLAEQIIARHPLAAGAGELDSFTRTLDEIVEFGEPVSQGSLIACSTRCLDALRAVSGSAVRVCDKNPFNFLSVGLIHMLMPRALIVHCSRNFLDTAISIHQTHFSRTSGLPTGGEDLVRYFRAYEKLMAHWHAILPTEVLYRLSYESLTKSPETEIKKLVSLLGLDWNAACLTPHMSSQLVKTPSGWQVRQTIHSGSVNKWRNYEPWLGSLAGLVENHANSPAS